MFFFYNLSYLKGTKHNKKVSGNRKLTAPAIITTVSLSNMHIPTACRVFLLVRVARTKPQVSIRDQQEVHKLRSSYHPF